jgi:hypothetical protein
MEYFPEYSHAYLLETNKASFPLANFTAVHVLYCARIAFFCSHIYSAAVHLVSGITELNSSVVWYLCGCDLT